MKKHKKIQIKLAMNRSKTCHASFNHKNNSKDSVSLKNVFKTWLIKANNY